MLRGGGGAHGDAGAGVFEEQREGDQEDRDRGRAVQIAPRHRQRADLDRLQREDLVHRPRVRAPDPLHDGAQDARKSQRHHDDGDDRLADEGAQHHPLQDQPEQGGEGEGQEQRGDHGDVRLRDDGQEDVGAEQEKLALGEVQDAARLVDDDESEGDQRVDASHHQAVDHQLEEKLHQAAPISRTARFAWMRAVRPSW